MADSESSTVRSSSGPLLPIPTFPLELFTTKVAAFADVDTMKASPLLGYARVEPAPWTATPVPSAFNLRSSVSSLSVQKNCNSPDEFESLEANLTPLMAAPVSESPLTGILNKISPPAFPAPVTVPSTASVKRVDVASALLVVSIFTEPVAVKSETDADRNKEGPVIDTFSLNVEAPWTVRVVFESKMFAPLKVLDPVKSGTVALEIATVTSPEFPPPCRPAPAVTAVISPVIPEVKLARVILRNALALSS